MNRRVSAFAAALALVVAGTASTATAQTLYGNISPPPVSPYININRGGAPAGVNYYNIVQPQIQFYNGLNRAQLAGNGMGPTGLVSPGGAELLATGHPVQFGNYLHYYSPGGVNATYGRIGGGFGGQQLRPGGGQGAGFQNTAYQSQGAIGQAPSRPATGGPGGR